MTLRARPRQCVRRLGQPAHKTSDSKANTDVRRATSAGGYAFKGGLNPAQSTITERPPLPPPFGGTGGASPATSAGQQSQGEASKPDGSASD